MPRLRIVIPNPAEVLETYDRVRVYYSATEDGAFSEVSTAGTRPAIRADETLYFFDHAAGASTGYYKTSYYNTALDEESDLSDAQQASGSSELDVVSVEELKSTLLFGVAFTDDAGNEMPDSLFIHHIKAAVQRVGSFLDLQLFPVTVEDEPHDFVPQDYYSAWNKIKLVKSPVRSVTSLDLYLPPNTHVSTYDSTWIKLDSQRGDIEVTPGSGQLILSANSFYAPFLAFSSTRAPHLWKVTYEAGYAKGQCPADIKHAVMLYAAMGPLNIAGDLLFGAGLAGEKVHMDSVMTEIRTTQSATNSGYGARINSYRKELSDLMPILRKRYKGVVTTAI